MATGPLQGVRVLEFSLIFSGPFGGLQLADLGADTIKVEGLEGEPNRNLPGQIPGAPKVFQVMNRGRRSLSLDLSRPEGREVVYRLMPSIDVVLINYRPGVAQRLGIDYESLRAYRPDLIYAEINGYGFEGPMAMTAGSDLTASAYGGVVALTDAYEEDGAPRPLYPPISGDLPSGLGIALGIVAALYHRQRTGEGQLVRTSLLHAAMHMTCFQNSTDPVQDPATRDLTLAALARVREAGGSYDDMVRARRGATLPNLFFRAYRAKDGGIVIGALTPANRLAIRKVLELQGQDQDDPGFSYANPGAREMMQARFDEIRAVVATRTVAEWVERFTAAGAPAGPVNFPEELPDDPQAGLHYVQVDHPISGPTRMVGPMVEMLGTPTAVQGHAPLLGEHSEQILAEAGYSPAEIAALEAANVVRAEG